MKALIVGSTADVSQLLQAHLQSLGIDCGSSRNAGPDGGSSSADVVFAVCHDSVGLASAEIRALRSSVRAPIVAVGAQTSAGEILELIRAGAADFVHRQQLGADLAKLISRLRVGNSTNPGRGKIVGVASASGGCGASTIAANLALALATNQRPCCLIDLQLGGGELATLLNLKPRHSVLDLCQAGPRLDETMLRQTLVAHSAHVHLLAAPPANGEAYRLDPDGLNQAIQLAATAFPHVVIDLGNPVQGPPSDCLQKCDLLLVVMRLDFPCLVRTRRVLDILRESGIEEERLRVVANRTSMGELPQKQAVVALGTPIFHTLPDDLPSALTAANLGNPVVLETPRTQIAKALRKLSELVSAV